MICLYLTLYPQAPDTASHVKSAEFNVILAVVALSGAVQGVNVVKVCVDDHADTELLPAEHAERICHSYVVDEVKFDFCCDVAKADILLISIVQVDEP